MNDFLRQSLKKEFEGAPATPENAALFEELLGNLTDRSQELAAQGMSGEEAQRRAFEEMGDIRPLLHCTAENAEKENRKPKKASKGKIYPPEELRRRKYKRGLGVAVAVALYILSVVPCVFGDLVALLIFPIAGLATAVLILTLNSTSGYLDNSAASYPAEWIIRDNSHANSLLAIGVFFCILSVVFPCFLESVGVALFFLSAAVGVFMILFATYLRPHIQENADGAENAPQAAVPEGNRAGRKKFPVWTVVLLAVFVMVGGFVTVLAIRGDDVVFMMEGDSRYSEIATRTGDGTAERAVQELVVNWKNGKVKVLPAPEGQENITFFATDKHGDPLPEDDSVFWGQEDEKLVLLFDKPARFRFFCGIRQQKHLTVLIPRGSAFEKFSIETTSAEVEAEGVSTLHADVETTSGNVTLTDFSASFGLDTKSTSGALKLTRVSAEVLHLDTTSGGVVLEGTAGSIQKVNASSTSGRLSLYGSFRDLQADTTSGEIRVTLVGGYENLKLESTSGDVTVDLGETTNGFSARLDTTSGKVAMNVPVEIRGNIYITENASATVSVETTSGDIHFEK